MAKLPFSKLNIKANTNILTLGIGDIEVEVKEYLPIEEKLNLISRIVNQSVDDNGFYNPIKIKIYETLEILYAYTNINFTDKMKAEVFKTYDLVCGSGLADDVIDLIFEEYDYIDKGVWHTIDSLYKYKNSVRGILDDVTTDYSNLSLDASQIQKDLADPENMTLLKNVLDKLG